MQITSEDIARLDGMLSASSRPLVVTHVHPDGDAVGSACAMKSYIESRAEKPGRTATILFCGRPSAAVTYILDGCAPGSVLFADEDDYSDVVENADLLLCLDFNNFPRTEALEGTLRALTCPKVLVDHHLQPSVEDFDLVFSETQISSASELLFWVLDAMPGLDWNEVPYQCRQALMSGMTTDTNNFANSVFPSTLQMASCLLATGVDRDFIIEKLYNSCRENRLRMIGYLLSEKMKITPYGVAYTLLDERTVREFDIHEGDLEGYVNMPLTIDRVKMSIYIREDGGKNRVSIRSKRGVSANQCSRRYFNGGGHEQAAGGRLPLFESAEKLEEYVLESTKEFFEA